MIWSRNASSAKPIEHFGGDDSRSNRVNANVLFSEFERDGFGQPFDRMLRRDVNAYLRETNVPRNAGSIDDSAAAIFEHDWNFVTHRIENAPNIDVENAAIFAFCRLLERTFPFDTRVVKRDVETAEFIDREINHRFHICIFRHVRADERRVAAKFLDFGDNLRAFFFAATAENNFCTRLSERDRGRFADAGSSAGHQCDFTFKRLLLFIGVSFIS